VQAILEETVEANTLEIAKGKPVNVGKTNDEDVKPILQDDIEELNKKLEERDGLITSLQKKLEDK
jgi:hypothetical protein